jgi:hypothetical protein
MTEFYSTVPGYREPNENTINSGRFIADILYDQDFNRCVNLLGAM